MTNMVPEVKNNCLWNRLEEYCRDSLTTDFETIYVMSGTLFLPVKTEDGREIVQYEVGIAQGYLMHILTTCSNVIRTIAFAYAECGHKFFELEHLQ